MDVGLVFEKLARDPAVQDQLSGAGFFVMNFAEGAGCPSGLMARLGYGSLGDYQKGFLGAVHPDDEEAFLSQWGRVSEGGQDTFHAEFRIRDRASGDWCWVLTHGTMLGRDQGRLVYAGVDLDVTARKLSETMVREQLYEAETVFHQAESLRVASLLANSSQDVGKTIDLVLGHAQGLLRFDAATVSVYRDAGFQELGSLGHPEHLETAHPRSPKHPLWAVLAGRSPVLRNDLEREGLDNGPQRYRSWLGIPLIFRQEFLGVVEFWHADQDFFQSDQLWPAMSFADSVAESIFNSRTLENLRADTRTDVLTGLHTRRYLQDVGPQLVEQCLAGNQPVAVLFVDLDHFKQINDSHGHLVGDAVLMTIAQLCRNALRKEDFFFRYGGEEFVALLPQTDASLAQKIAERLRETAAAARFRGLEKGVTLSIGVVPLVPGHQIPFEQLLQEADQAMYRAKERGRDRVTVSDRWTR